TETLSRQPKAGVVFSNHFSIIVNCKTPVLFISVKISRKYFNVLHFSGLITRPGLLHERCRLHLTIFSNCKRSVLRYAAIRYILIAVHKYNVGSINKVGLNNRRIGMSHEATFSSAITGKWQIRLRLTGYQQVAALIQNNPRPKYFKSLFVLLRKRTGAQR